MDDSFKITSNLCEAAIFTAAVGGAGFASALMGAQNTGRLLVIGSAAAATSISLSIIKTQAAKEERLKLTLKDEPHSERNVVGKFTNDISEELKNESSLAFTR